MPNITLNSVQLYYESHGSGDEAIVLFNGITMNTTGWLWQLPALLQQRRVILLDFRGQGKSEHPVCEAYSLDQQADDVAALMSALGIEKFDVLGLSYGGMVALHMAQRHLARIKRLVLASTLAYADAANEAIKASWLEIMQCGGQDLRFVASVPWLYGSRFIESQRAVLEQIRAQGVDIDWPAVVRLMNGVSEHDARPWLSSIVVPTLILAGDEDRLTPPYQARHLALTIPDALLVELTGYGHALHIEAPLQFNEALTSFLFS